MSNYLDDYLAAYGEGFGYAFDNNIISNWYPERIIRLNPGRGRFLELGIGRGVTTNRFSLHFERHVVIEGSPAVIEKFRKNFRDCKAKVVQAYFEDFDTEERFDVIAMGFILEHVENPQAILEKFRNFLAPGGRCFVAVPNGESLHRRFGQAAGFLGDLMELGKGDLDLGHRRVYSVETLSNDIERAGYRVERKEGIFLKPLTTEQLRSLSLDPKILQGMCEVGIDFPELSCALLFEAMTGTERSV